MKALTNETLKEYLNETIDTKMIFRTQAEAEAKLAELKGAKENE